MSSVPSDLLAPACPVGRLARALAAGLVTPAEAAERLLILACRVRVSVARVEAVDGRGETLAPSTAEEGA